MTHIDWTVTVKNVSKGLNYVEMLKSGGWEAEIIDKCSSALNNFVELHYDKVRFFSVSSFPRPLFVFEIISN